MRSIPDQAELILASVLLQEAQMRAARVPAALRWNAMKPGLEALLTQFQDEMLESQRETSIALAQALNIAGGK